MKIHEFQEMMRVLYLHRDSVRGITGTYRRLLEEAEELGEELDSDNHKALEGEFADVLAWLASLANLMEIDLERSATRKYRARCPKCLHSPCDCAL